MKLGDGGKEILDIEGFDLPRLLSDMDQSMSQDGAVFDKSMDIFWGGIMLSQPNGDLFLDTFERRCGYGNLSRPTSIGLKYGLLLVWSINSLATLTIFCAVKTCNYVDKVFFKERVRSHQLGM